jgi:hypothetical protein
MYRHLVRTRISWKPDECEIKLEVTHELDLKFLVKVGAITGLAYGKINLIQEWYPKLWLNDEGNLV